MIFYLSHFEGHFFDKVSSGKQIASGDIALGILVILYSSNFQVHFISKIDIESFANVRFGAFVKTTSARRP